MIEMDTVVRTDPEKIQVETPGKVSFAEIHSSMLELQAKMGSSTGDVEADRLFLFEPSPVVTLGSRSADSSSILDPEKLKERGVEIHTVDRGGEATYHGPGQLIAYPVVRLREEEGPSRTAPQAGSSGDPHPCRLGNRRRKTRRTHRCLDWL